MSTKVRIILCTVVVAIVALIAVLVVMSNNQREAVLLQIIYNRAGLRTGEIGKERRVGLVIGHDHQHRNEGGRGNPQPGQPQCPGPVP